MPILDLQKRARELGRIRLGQVVPTGDEGKTRPEKLDRFRLTSNSRPLLEKVAELYGGQVAEWQPQGGGAKAWEVVTDSTRLPIMVPPQPISQWFEYWTAGGCKHRCDGRTNVLTDELCDPEDVNHKRALEKPTTRLNVVLRDVEGIGVWRIETHGWNAAMELPDAAEFLARAGGYVNGWVSLEPRTSKAEVPDRKNGGTKIITRHFHVPIIEIDVTPAQLMAGQGSVRAPQLEGPVPQQPAALGAGGTAQESVPDAYTPFFERLGAATTLEECQALWHDITAANLRGGNARSNPEADPGRAAEFLEAYKAKGPTLAPAEPKGTGATSSEEVVEGEVVDDGQADDPEAVWQQILKVAGEQEISLPDLQDDFSVRMGGLDAATASAAELRVYLEQHLSRPAEAVGA